MGRSRGCGLRVVGRGGYKGSPDIDLMLDQYSWASVVYAHLTFMFDSFMKLYKLCFVFAGKQIFRLNRQSTK